MTHSSRQTLDVLISEVTRMRDGAICVAGWCEAMGRMVRPLRRDACLRWSERYADAGVFVVGHVIRFVRARQLSERGAPHMTDDVVVEGTPRVIDRLDADETRRRLAGSLSASVRDAFDDKLSEDRYVIAGELCSSLGAIEIEPRHLSFDRTGHGVRCLVADRNRRYSLPLTCRSLTRMLVDEGIGAVDRLRRAAKVVHVRLGLAHPWKGPQGQFSPRRCYPQVNGLIFAGSAS